MALKFRRGTTAQKSGSLAYGEPYVNTDLGTLQIGGASGDITLGSSGTGSQGSFAGISGSSLDITGNAKIDGNLTLGGNITIGDNTSDTVNVTAALSSSLIPQTTNAFDLGSSSKIWRDLYISTGSIKFVEGTTVVKTLSAATLTALETSTGSANASIISLNSFSASTLGHITDINTKTGSLETKNTTLATYTASLETKNTTLATYTASIDTKFSTLQTLTASMAAQVSRLQESTASLNAFTNSFNSAIQLTGSNVNIGGNLIVAGTTTTINSTNVAIADSVIELNYGGSVVKSGILTKDGTGGSTISGSLLWDGTNDYWIAGISGSELPLATTTGTQTLTNKTIDGSQLVALSVANGKLANSSITIAGTSTALGGAITAEQIRTAIGTVVTGSSQISHDSTTGYVANRHIDHTSVLISAGNGLSGGGDISSTRTLALDTTSATFTTGVKSKLDVDGVISGSKTITIAGTSTALGSSITAEQIRTAIGTVVTGSSQITGITNAQLVNSSVTVTAGTGMSGGGAVALGSSVTLTNAGVTSNVAGTGVTVSGATGAVTISIGQAVATSSSPTFAGLTINGAITATGDITAYFTSDIRHKNNVQLIDNALDKVNALNGVTWEWNDDVDEVTKQTPKTGLIAQDVLDVLPEVVKTRENGFLALDYSKMIGLLVEAIKEQDVVIQKLKSDVIGLSTTITVFEDRMKEKGLL